MNSHRRTLAALSLVTTLAVAAACGASRGGSAPLGQGQLAVSMVDAPNPAVDAIVVNVVRVTAHSTSGGWATIAENVGPIDVLTLQTSAKDLGLANLQPGTITQIRLVLATDGNYVM